MQRFLFIGVGGSGGGTLRRLRWELERRLARAGVAQLPAGWQFLHIDSRTTQEHVDDLPQLPSEDYLGLIEPRVTYPVVERQLKTRHAAPAARVACLGWRPDPTQVHTPLDKGAGQYRAIGRAIAVTMLGQIKNRIDQKINQVQMANMAAVSSALLNTDAAGQQPSPIAVVVSSLAGGSGSGIFMDVCDVLRASGEVWAAEPVAVLYAPDVFNGLKENLRRGVQPNALATISELLAGHWLSDTTHDPLHETAGMTEQDDRRSGPSYAFLVGATNDTGQLSFTHPDEVFAAVSRAVAAWATNPAIQTEYGAYLAGNWQQQAEQADPFGLSQDRLSMPFSALGYASVSLGRDLFHEYAAQCLARAVADRLLPGVASGSRKGALDVEERVRQRRAEFSAAVLDLPRTDGQRDAELVIKNLPGRLDPGRTSAVQDARDAVQLSFGDRPRPMNEWKQVILSTITQSVPRVLDARRKALHVTAASWINTVEVKLRGRVVDSLVADGLPVTRRLIETMINILSAEVVQGMEQNAITDDEAAVRVRDEIDASAQGVPSGRFGRKNNRLFDANTGWIRHAVERGVECAIGRRFDAEVRRLAAQLVQDLVDGLLRPMSGELERALQMLRQDATSSGDNRPATIDLWPQAPAWLVPTGLRPTRTQFLIDPVDDYPKELTRLLIHAVPGTERADDAIAGAVRTIMTDQWEQPADLSPVVEQTGSWRPASARAWSEHGEQDAGFVVSISAKHLLLRCLAWTRQAPGISAYLQENLASALGGAQPSTAHLERLGRYRTQFAEALNAAAPLVRVDTNYQAMHMTDGVARYTPLISPIPLTPDTPAYETTCEQLVAHGQIDKDRLESLFSPSGAGEIEFTTFLTAPRHPIGFVSLIEPIRQDWLRKRINATGRASFAQWRRARPLPRAVGLPRQVRLQLMRGWLIAFLNSRKVELVEDQQLVIRLHVNDNDPTPADFPLLGQPPRCDDALDSLAAVLESFALVFVDALTSGKDIESYRRLLAARIDTGLPEVELLSTVTALIGRLEAHLSPRAPVDRVTELAADLRQVLTELHTELAEYITPNERPA